MEEMYVHPDGLEQSGRISHGAADSAEQVHRTLNRVEASAGTYGGATGFVESFNAARRGHVRGAGAAAEDRTTMGEADHGAAGFSHDLDLETGRIVRGAADPPPDWEIAHGI